MYTYIIFDTTGPFLPVKNDILKFPLMNIINVYDIYWFYDQYNIEIKHYIDNIRDRTYTNLCLY